MADAFRALCQELVETLAEHQDRLEDAYHPDHPEADRLDRSFRLLERARDALAQPEPEALTVQECNDMRKHRENYIYEYCDGDIELDGCFSREDLLELARTIPANPRPPES